MDNALCGLCLLVAVHQAGLDPLINKLGHKDFKVREKTQKEISKQFEVPWQEFLLKDLSRYDSDAEIRIRLRQATSKLRGYSISYGKYVWIDALPYDFPDREKTIKKYLDLSSEVYMDFLIADDYQKWRYATYLLLKDLKASGWYDSSLRSLQQQMVPMESHWIIHKSYPKPNQ